MQNIETATTELLEADRTAREDDAKRVERNRKARLRRQQREQIMLDCGLTKVRGAVSGKTYWE